MPNPGTRAAVCINRFYMKLKKAFPVILALLPAFSAALSAAEQTDSTEQINALEYSLQKRFRPENETFVSEKFTDNTFINIHGGTANVAAFGDTRYNFGPSAGISAGKWIDRCNAIRPALSWNRFTRKQDLAEFNTASLGVSHLFNISAYMGGYRRDRFFEVSTVEGLMYTCSFMDRKARHSLGINLGINMNFRLPERLDFFIEPGVIAYTDGIDHSGAMNWHHYDLEYGVSMGLGVNLHSSGTGTVKPERKKRDRHTYIAIAVGPQFQNSSIVVREIGLLNSLGTHCSITAGTWVSDFFALQASAFYSSDKWIRDIDGGLKSSRYIGLRVEGRFDPLMLVHGWKERSCFSVPLLLGPECGYMHKDDRAMKIGKMYLGLAAAAQLRFRLADFIALYIEPRFSIVPYYLEFHSDYIYESGVMETYYDGLVNLNFGIEIDISSIREMLEK